MSKKLIKLGNSMALVIDKPLLDLLKINNDTELDLDIEGNKLNIKPKIDIQEVKQLINNDDIVDNVSILPDKKQRVTIHISSSLIERIKNAVYWTPGLTVASFCEQALSKAIDKLEKEKGESFPSRRENLKGGRPLK